MQSLVNGEVHDNEQPPELERPAPARGKRKSHHSDSKGLRLLYKSIMGPLFDSLPEPAHPVEASVNDDEVAHSNGQGPSSVPADDQAVKEPEQSSSPSLPPMNML